jgi:ABC-type transporter Mla subunit MlaD
MLSPDSRTTARILGYSLILGVILLLIFLAAFFFREAVHTDRTIRVHFPEIATLSAGDPVVEAGVTVGVIRSITLENGVPIANLRLFHHRFLSSDSRFVNFSHSLMGARKVWILPGSSPLPLNDSAVQAGLFAPGLPETLHKVQALVDRVRQLRQAMDRLQDTGSTLSGALAVNRRLDDALQALGVLSITLDSAGTWLQSGLATIVKAGDQVSALLGTADSGLDSAHARVENLRVRYEAASAQLAGVLATTETLLATSGDSTRAGSLLTDQSVYESLLQSVVVLEKTTRLLRRDGLGDDMKIKPRLRLRKD